MKFKLLSPKKSIKSQLIISFLIPFLVFGIVICIFFMTMMSNIVNDNVITQFDHRLEENSKALAKNLDPGLINHVMEAPQEYGRNLEMYLDSFIKEKKGIQFAYVLSRQDGKDVIVALNGKSSFMSENPFTSYQKEAFEQKKVVYSSIYKDKWGVHQSIFVPIDGTDAIIGMDMDASFLDTLQTKMYLYPSIFLVLAVIIGLALAIFIGNRISKPLQRVVGFTKTVAAGNLSESIQSDREDEIGDLANSFENMRLNLSSIIDNVRGNSQTINESSNILFTSFEELAGASEQIVDSTNEEVTGSEERAKHVEKISNMISDMTAAIENMDTQTKQIKDVTFNTSKLSQEGSGQVQMVSEQINKIKNNGLVTKENLSDLNNKLEHINKIIVLISEISSQTNLLSLNASIEAARAGEAGKGFSVVAQEIQKLANQTATSTQDISNIVNEINKQTDKVLQLNQQDFEDIVEGVEIVEQNGKLFNEIFHAVEELKTRSESIFESSENIAKASDTTLSSIQEIVAISEEGLANTEEIAASATQQNYTVETLQHQNELLRNVAETLQETVGKFHTGNEVKVDNEESISEE